ncbi:MAG: OmpW family protein [Sterolibacterium sp.]|nr:OmpW family protein [Sterolibacterium sp.]MBP9799174.1 OmpW family protein [Sterolibacterium sp.]
MIAARCLATCTLLMASNLAHATAGEWILSPGIAYLNNDRSSSTPQHNVLAPSIATQSGLVPTQFDSPGTEQTSGNATSLILRLAYFMTDNWAISLNLGTPPKIDVLGKGSVTTPGLLNKVVPPVFMGDPANNPVATAVHWYPSAMVQYYFGSRNDTFRPFVSLGLGYSFFRDVKVSPNFEKNLKQAGGFMAMASTLSTQTTVEADASSAWAPLYNVGLAYYPHPKWVAGVAVSYVPTKTVSTIRIKDKTGNVILTSSAKMDIPTVATSLTLGYRF